MRAVNTDTDTDVLCMYNLCIMYCVVEVEGFCQFCLKIGKK